MISQTWRRIPVCEGPTCLRWTRRKRRIALVVAVGLLAGPAMIGVSAAEAASLGIRPKQVDFIGGNHEVLLDQFGTDPKKIGDGVDWKDDDTDGTTNKNWPVSYKKKSTITLDVTFAVKIEGPAPAKVTFTGRAKFGGIDLVFEKKDETLLVPETRVTGLTSELPDKVTLAEPMTIHWTATAKHVNGVRIYGAGTSTHNLYTTLADPLPGTLVYFTLLDYTAHGADGATGVQATVDGIWSRLKGPSNLRQRKVKSETGKITLSTYLSYYDPEMPGFRTCTGFTTAYLLKQGRGQCGAWARLLQDSLALHGIDSEFKPILPSRDVRPGSKFFLVKGWKFGGCMPASGNAVYPYSLGPAEMKKCDIKGIPGQNNPNPTSWFDKHFVILTPVGAATQLYDPSYGKQSPDLATYLKEAIAGTCIGTFPKDPDAAGDFPMFSAKCREGLP